MLIKTTFLLFFPSTTTNNPSLSLPQLLFLYIRQQPIQSCSCSRLTSSSFSRPSPQNLKEENDIMSLDYLQLLQMTPQTPHDGFFAQINSHPEFKRKIIQHINFGIRA
ncbi:hypothetical protein HanIR_Chr17g0859831 [Helianthus annuus]|nr:hypothetical protein HanIR_Chr17g0859831 [Helianthus annuus]